LTFNDPPLLVSGAVDLTLDPRGRLLSFWAVPPQAGEATGPAPAPDWSALFAEAGLDIANFTPATSRWLPPVNCDSRAAWEGVYPYQSQFPLHIEAAAYRGRPVYFEMIGPWDKPARLGESQQSANAAIVVILNLVLICTGAWLARRNLRLGRGDRKGAFRLALYCFVTSLLAWVLVSHHVPTSAEVEHFITALAFATLTACFFWLLYLSLEPYVRRRWPHQIVSWSRLLAGQFRDPMVGRDLLIGALFEISVRWLNTAIILTAYYLLGFSLDKPIGFNFDMLNGLRGIIGAFLGIQVANLIIAILIQFTLVLLTRLLRKQWLAFGVAWLIFTFYIGMIGNYHVAIYWIVMGVFTACWIIIQARFGLLAAASFFVWSAVLHWLPITSDFSAWYAEVTIFVLGVYLAICGYGFYTSLGGQKVIAGELLED
jgi:serine/threonine-protein kinase